MEIKVLDEKSNWFVEKPIPLAPAKYVTIALLRTTTDYAAFRTEADKTINSVVTPKSISNNETIERVALLASKQKAVERRKAEQIIRDLKEDYNCYLKDNLCLTCPVCVLNGGVGTVKKGTGAEISIRSRILYQTAYSIESLENSVETIVFNAVDELTTETGQALNERELVKPGIHFVSVISLLAPTLGEVKFTLKYILETTRYGAETRGIGTIKNSIVGIGFSNSEITSALELLLKSELTDKLQKQTIPEDEIVKELHSAFQELASDTNAESLSDDQIQTIANQLKTATITNEFINALFEKSEQMASMIEKSKKQKK